MSAQSSQYSQRCFEQAVAWFVALQSEDCDAAKRSMFQHWLAKHASHAAAYAEAEKLWANLEPLKTGHVPDLSAARKAGVQPRAGRASLIALLATVLATGWWLDYRVEPVSYATAIGRRQAITLADGSTIQLNARSRLSVKLSWCRREIALLEGDALFDVTHQPLRPFTVQAKGLQIRDIGTRFTVRQRAERVRVSVLEGEVALKPDHAWLGQSLVAGHSRELDQNGHLQAIENSDTAQETDWFAGRLVFEHAPMAEIVEELERHHAIRFVIADPSLGKKTLSGSFDITDLQPFLRAVETMLPVRVIRQKDRIVLSGRR